MDLASLIEPDGVVFGARASNKQQLLQDLASRAAALLNLDAQMILAMVLRSRMLASKGSIGFSACSRGCTVRSISTRLTAGRSISCSSCSSRRRPATSILALLQRLHGNCATKNLPRNFARQTPQLRFASSSAHLLLLLQHETTMRQTAYSGLRSYKAQPQHAAMEPASSELVTA
jgi:hypothetical protein